MRVMEYLKSEGRKELEDFTGALQNQIVALKKKQIRERKKTWLYKAEKAKRKAESGSQNNLRKSTARVTPEVNLGMDSPDDEATSPRQSSLSVFQEFKKQRCAQVHPSEDGGTPEDNLSNSSAMELKNFTRP